MAAKPVHYSSDAFMSGLLRYNANERIIRHNTLHVEPRDFFLLSVPCRSYGLCFETALLTCTTMTHRAGRDVHVLRALEVTGAMTEPRLATRVQQT